MPIHHCAKRLGISVAEAERQEEPTTDLTLTQLRAWQEVLDAPLSEILAPGTADLENPVRNRALLVKVMKTARQIQETARESRILSIAGTLVDQLIEVMPELDGISAWPDVGQSHENRELGRTAIRRFEVVLPRRTNP